MGPLNFLSPHSNLSAPLTASGHAVLNVGGRDATAAGGNVNNSVATNITISPSTIQLLSPIRTLASTVQRGSEVCRSFQPESDVDAATAAVIQRDDESSEKEGLMIDGSFDNNLSAVVFQRNMLRTMASVVMVRFAPLLESYAANFPQVINAEYILNYNGPFAHATAFLISPGLLLTNYHVFPNAASAGHEMTKLGFDFDEEDQKCALGELRPQDFFFSDRKLDFAVVAFIYPDAEYVNEDVAAGVLIDSRRRQPLVLRKRVQSADSADMRLVVVGHPGGRVKQVSLPGCMTPLTLPDPLNPGQRQPHPHILLYSNDTQCGSSGSPVLNMHWQLLGLHHSALKDAGGLLKRTWNTLTRKTVRQYNQGTTASAIWEMLMQEYVKCKSNHQEGGDIEANAKAMLLLRTCLLLDTDLSKATKMKLQ